MRSSGTVPTPFFNLDFFHSGSSSSNVYHLFALEVSADFPLSL